MDFKTVLPKGKGGKKEYFWSLVLEQGWVQAGVWNVVDGTSNVVSVGPSTPWESFDELVNAADTALSAVIQKLEADIDEPSKTVIGVPGSWVENGNIKGEYLSVIKKICTELSLKPTGFVVLSEAIAHLVKSKEGAPLTGIVMGVGSKAIDISLFRDGKLVNGEVVSRSVSIVDDAVEGLTRISTEQEFPSRFLLYNGKQGELEDAKQALVAYDWQTQDKLKFLHVPSVESVNPDDKVLAVSLAGGVEMAGVETVKVEEPEVVPIGVEPKTDGVEVVAPIAAAELGFAVGKDVSQGGSDLSAFTENKQESVPAGEPLTAVANSVEATPTQTAVAEPDALSVKKKKIPIIGIALPSFGLKKATKSKESSVEAFTPPGQNKPGKGKMVIIVAVVVFVGLMVAGFFAWWNLPKAEVIIYVSPKKIEDNANILVDTEATSVDYETKTIPGKVVSTSASGEETKSTTGIKTIGEKAAGSVEIRNGTSSSVRVSEGTTLIATNDLLFVTDSSASVSAAVSTTTPGSETVSVTASDIGPEYNLAEGEVMAVDDYSKAEVEAVATTDFSGGSSSQIAAVSEEDAEGLEEGLKSELIDEAIEELNNGLAEDEVLIEESIESEVTSREFSAKVGDEAANLKLSLTVEVSGVVVKNDDVFDLVEKTLGERVPEGFVLRSEQVDVEFDFSGEDGGVYEVEVSVTANLLPEVKPDEVAEKITGKYPALAEDYLNSISGFSRAEIKLTPSLPGRLGTLPHVEKNITIEISAER